MDKYIVLGIGAYVANVDEILSAHYGTNGSNMSYELLGFIDNDSTKKGKDFYGFKVLGNLDFFMKYDEELNVISFINPQGRSELIEPILGKHNLNFPNVVHPSAIVSKKAVVGHGNIFAQNTVVAPYAIIGNFNLLNYQVSIGHNCQIGNYITMNGGVHLAGSSIVEDKVFIGPGAVIIDNIRVGKRSRIGANAVVRNDVPPDVTAVGVPAKIKHKGDTVSME